MTLRNEFLLMQMTKYIPVLPAVSNLCVQLIVPEPCIYLVSLHLHLQVWAAHPQHAKQMQNQYLQVKD